MSRDGMEVDVTVQQEDASMVELGALKLVVFGRLKKIRTEKTALILRVERSS
jgi:hypothetical protein